MVPVEELAGGAAEERTCSSIPEAVGHVPAVGIGGSSACLHRRFELRSAPELVLVAVLAPAVCAMLRPVAAAAHQEPETCLPQRI